MAPSVPFVVALLACILACGKGQLVRVAVFCASSICYAILAVVLIFLPRNTDATATSRSPVTDASNIFRVLYFSFVSLFAVLGLAMVLLNHVMPKQTCPEPPDLESNERVRLAR
jgi:hypothetical protein